MKQLKTTILSIFICFSQLYGEIIEISNFKEVPSHVMDSSLVLLDIDDTLMINVQMVGTDEWFHHRLNTFVKFGLPFSEALEKAIAEDEALQNISEMKIVEEGTEAIVDEMQKQGYVVMGLTTRGFGIAKCTTRQLLEKTIDLSKTAPSSKDHYAQVGDHAVLYRKGILFTGGTHKGEALFRFCDAIGLHPKRIVFVNDKASHLAQIEEAAKSRNIPFLGLRYAYSDARKAGFQLPIAECQFYHSNFHRLLTDEEAKAILQAKNH